MLELLRKPGKLGERVPGEALEYSHDCLELLASSPSPIARQTHQASLGLAFVEEGLEAHRDLGQGLCELGPRFRR
jgi:hypothetical protein